MVWWFWKVNGGINLTKEDRFGTDLERIWEFGGNCLGIVWNYPILIIS